MRSIRFLLCFAAICIVGAEVRAQDPFIVRVDVSLVTLDVQISDAAGRPVTTLKKEDFEIYENGRLQQLGSFAPVESPYSVLILFDCSNSTRPNWPFLVQSINGFTAKLRSQDRIAVAQFGGGFKKLVDWIPGSRVPRDVQVQPEDRSCNSTDFYGAINRALAEVRTSAGRKGVVVLTDGQHNKVPLQRVQPNEAGARRYVDAENDDDFQKIYRAVRISDVVFYFVAINTDLNPDRGGSRGYNPLNIYNLQQFRARMELLAEDSGGRVAFPREPEEVIPLFEEIGHELGTSYGLGYTPDNLKNDGAYRKIEVRIRDKSLQVRQSRTGYEAR
jgi:Ca-activated chloride channel family protein